MLKDAVIIEASGGVVRKVYATTDLKVIVVDHDNFEEAGNIIEAAADVAKGVKPDSIVQHDKVGSFVLDLIAPAQTCGECRMKLRDAGEITSLQDHGKCISCLKDWQLGVHQNDGEK